MNESRPSAAEAYTWTFNLRDRKTGLQSESDSDSDDEDGATPTADAKLLKELDLSTREDAAMFKSNPWSFAKINAASKPSAPRSDAPVTGKIQHSKPDHSVNSGHNRNNDSIQNEIITRGTSGSCIGTKGPALGKPGPGASQSKLNFQAQKAARGNTGPYIGGKNASVIPPPFPHPITQQHSFKVAVESPLPRVPMADSSNLMTTHVSSPTELAHTYPTFSARRHFSPNRSTPQSHLLTNPGPVSSLHSGPPARESPTQTPLHSQSRPLKQTRTASRYPLTLTPSSSPMGRSKFSQVMPDSTTFAHQISQTLPNNRLLEDESLNPPLQLSSLVPEYLQSPERTEILKSTGKTTTYLASPVSSPPLKPNRSRSSDCSAPFPNLKRFAYSATYNDKSRRDAYEFAPNEDVWSTLPPRKQPHRKNFNFKQSGRFKLPLTSKSIQAKEVSNDSPISLLGRKVIVYHPPPKRISTENTTLPDHSVSARWTVTRSTEEASKASLDAVALESPQEIDKSNGSPSQRLSTPPDMCTAMSVPLETINAHYPHVRQNIYRVSYSNL